MFGFRNTITTTTANRLCGPPVEPTVRLPELPNGRQGRAVFNKFDYLLFFLILFVCPKRIAKRAAGSEIPEGYSTIPAGHYYPL
ncbi:hypothetical protein A8C56_09240 [Niabella ginsenosidivorans]|uniref:Uncharacterized protein n=1 Tax=Niabella ginsenosidivorans TaxID=1176587 RepID=A0A1A9I0I6_9BACT|nr:hypothetical protein A8C56_09240 [Niabella ginsenosidivorans]